MMFAPLEGWRHLKVTDRHAAIDFAHAREGLSDTHFAGAAKIGGVTLQIVRDWVLRFNADGPNGLVDRKAPGQPSLLKDEHRAALARVVEDGPTPAIHGVVRWRIVDLCQWLFEEFRISVSETTMSRELRAMSYRKLSARPRHHAQRDGAIDEFKKISPHAWKKSRGKRASTRAT